MENVNHKNNNNKRNVDFHSMCNDLKERVVSLQTTWTHTNRAHRQTDQRNDAVWHTHTHTSAPDTHTHNKAQLKAICSQLWCWCYNQGVNDHIW